MRERYDQIDRELLPLLPNDSECRETLGRKIPKAGNISDYIQKMLLSGLSEYRCYLL